VTWDTGTKGPLTARFAAVRVRPTKDRGERWLLCERAVRTDERKYYLLNLPATATRRELVTVVRGRWPIEQQYRELKDELGIDHFEGGAIRGAHHVVLTAMAFTFLQLERTRSTETPLPTLPAVRTWLREIMAVLYVISQPRWMNLIVSFQRNPPLRRQQSSARHAMFGREHCWLADGCRRGGRWTICEERTACAVMR
jgi:hypothetical protein